MGDNIKFAIQREKRKGITFLTLKNLTTKESVEVIPEHGGTVNKIFFLMNDGIENILFSDKDNEIKKNPLFRGRILFPFNDIIPGGKYNFNGREYGLKINDPKTNTAIHGFLYREKMEIVSEEIGEDSCSLLLRREFGQVRGYPFPITLALKYTLKDSSIRLDFFIANSGSTPLPLALGWHPYFTFNNFPDDVVLKSDSEGYVEVDEDLLPTGKILSCRNTKFDFRNGKSLANFNIDNALKVPENGITVISQGKNRISIEQDTKIFKFIQLYIPDDHGAIAVEPISAATNSFNNSLPGLITLLPGEEVKTFAVISTSK